MDVELEISSQNPSSSHEMKKKRKKLRSDLSSEENQDCGQEIEKVVKEKRRKKSDSLVTDSGDFIRSVISEPVVVNASQRKAKKKCDGDGDSLEPTCDELSRKKNRKKKPERVVESSGVDDDDDITLVDLFKEGDSSLKKKMKKEKGEISGNVEAKTENQSDLTGNTNSDEERKIENNRSSYACTQNATVLVPGEVDVASLDPIVDGTSGKKKKKKKKEKAEISVNAGTTEADNQSNLLGTTNLGEERNKEAETVLVPCEVDVANLDPIADGTSGKKKKKKKKENEEISGNMGTIEADNQRDLLGTTNQDEERNKETKIVLVPSEVDVADLDPIANDTLGKKKRKKKMKEKEEISGNVGSTETDNQSNLLGTSIPDEERNKETRIVLVPGEVDVASLDLIADDTSDKKKRKKRKKTTQRGDIETATVNSDITDIEPAAVNTSRGGETKRDSSCNDTETTIVGNDSSVSVPTNADATNSDHVADVTFEKKKVKRKKKKIVGDNGEATIVDTEGTLLVPIEEYKSIEPLDDGEMKKETNSRDDVGTVVVDGATKSDPVAYENLEKKRKRKKKKTQSDDGKATILVTESTLLVPTVAEDTIMEIADDGTSREMENKKETNQGNDNGMAFVNNNSGATNLESVAEGTSGKKKRKRRKNVTESGDVETTCVDVCEMDNDLRQYIVCVNHSKDNTDSVAEAIKENSMTIEDQISFVNGVNDSLSKRPNQDSEAGPSLESEKIITYKRKRKSSDEVDGVLNHVAEFPAEKKSANHQDSHLGVVREEESISQLPNSLPERALVPGPRKKLLILDVNGILVEFVQSNPKKITPDIRISGKDVFKRPYCDDFLDFCFEKFTVAVWTSRLKFNMIKVIDFLFGDSQKKLLFSWDRSQCTMTEFNTIENKGKPLVLKELRKVWDKLEPDLPFEKGDYDETNTLLLDDSPYKALCNPVNTAIFPASYIYTDQEDNQLGPGGALRVYLQGLASAENVQKYVEQRPFGLPSISESDDSWEYYAKVIKAVEERSKSQRPRTFSNHPGSRMSRGDQRSGTFFNHSGSRMSQGDQRSRTFVSHSGERMSQGDQRPGTISNHFRDRSSQGNQRPVTFFNHNGARMSLRDQRDQRPGTYF